MQWGAVIVGLGIAIYLARNLFKTNIHVQKAYTSPDHSDERYVR